MAWSKPYTVNTGAGGDSRYTGFVKTGDNIDDIYVKLNLLNESHYVSLRIDGLAVVGTNLAGFLAEIAGTFVACYLYSDTAPTNASILVDINKNGTTVFSTQTNRPAVLSTANAGNTTTFNTTTFAVGDRITFDIDQVGSSVAGGNHLYITLVFTTR